MQKMKAFQTLSYFEIFVEFKCYLLLDAGTTFCAICNQAKQTMA